jgi:hypothetical protein
MDASTGPTQLDALVEAARSPSWEERAASGRRLAPLAGDHDVDGVLGRLLLDEDTAVTYDTAIALLQRGGLHALRIVLLAWGEAGTDNADEIAGAIFHAYGDSWEKWGQAWQRCTGLATDPDERVRRAANSVLAYQPSSGLIEVSRARGIRGLSGGGAAGA